LNSYFHSSSFRWLNSKEIESLSLQIEAHSQVEPHPAVIEYISI
jgi:hypothetical protein